MKPRHGWLCWPVGLVLLGAAVCGADTQYYAAYDVFTRDVINTARWSFYAYYSHFRNVQVSDSGTLPEGLSYVTERCGAPEVEAWTGYFRGTVTAVSSLPESYLHAVTLTYEQRDFSYHNPTDPLEQKWDSVTDTHHTRLRVDDHANTPGDTNHLTTLAVQTAWSEHSGWVNGHLYPGEVWGQQLLPADVDVFRIDTDAGVYCVETEANLDITAPALSLVVFKKAAGQDAYDGEWIARTNHHNVYGSSGAIDLRRQRVYFTLDSDNGAYVQISPNDGCNARTYRVRVFHARPVILIHGIECYPKIKDDVEAGKNSLGNWETYLPWNGACYPVRCHSYAWNSMIHPVIHKGSEILAQLINITEDVNPSVETLKADYNNEVTMIAHSMGGYLARYALNYSEDNIRRVILLASPQYGSDIALGSVNKVAQWCKQTSRDNLLACRRGSDYVWHMHTWKGKEKLVCVAGKGARLPSGLLFLLPYSRGIEYGNSDGGVPRSSAVVKGCHRVIEDPANARDHGTTALATYVDPTPGNYPVCLNPPSALAQAARYFFWTRRFYGSEDQGTRRWNPAIIFNDYIFNEVCKELSE